MLLLFKKQSEKIVVLLTNNFSLSFTNVKITEKVSIFRLI